MWDRQFYYRIYRLNLNDVGNVAQIKQESISLKLDLSPNSILKIILSIYENI